MENEDMKFIEDYMREIHEEVKINIPEILELLGVRNKKGGIGTRPYKLACAYTTLKVCSDVLNQVIDVNETKLGKNGIKDFIKACDNSLEVGHIMVDLDEVEK